MSLLLILVVVVKNILFYLDNKYNIVVQLQGHKILTEKLLVKNIE